MTILTTIIKSGPYTGNDVTVSFDYDFTMQNSTDLKVKTIIIATGVETLLVEGVDYSVSGIGDAGGGSITYPLVGVPLPPTHQIFPYSETVIDQSTDIRNQDGWFPEVHEDLFDKLVRILQELDDQLGRQPALNIQSVYSNLTMEDPVAGKLLGWNSGLTGLVNFDSLAGSVLVSSFLEAALDETTLGAFLGALGVTANMQTLIAAANYAAARELLSVVTTRGDIMYRGAAVEERLAKGALKTVLRMGADDPEWAADALFSNEADVLEKGFGLTPVQLTKPSGDATIDLDLGNGNSFAVIIDANATLANPTFIADQLGGMFEVVVTNDEVGGFTFAFDSLYYAQSNSASYGDTANYVHRITCTIRSIEITGITEANPAVVTAPNHGFANSDVFRIDGVVGAMSGNVNDANYTAAGITDDTLQLSGVDSTLWGSYTSGGRLFVIDTFIERIK